MFSWYTVVVTKVAFGLTPKVFDPVDRVLLLSKMLRMLNTKVLKPRYIQRIVGTIAIRIHEAIGLDFPLDNRQQARCPCVLKYLSIHLPPSL